MLFDIHEFHEIGSERLYAFLMGVNKITFVHVL